MAQGSNIFPFRRGFACAKVRFFSEIQKTKSEASWLIRAKSLMLKLQLECHKELMCRKRGKSMKEETIIKTRTA